MLTLKTTNGFNKHDMTTRNFSIDRWQMDVTQTFLRTRGYHDYVRDDHLYRGRLIPLCTPSVFDPPVLVLGTNHAEFLIRGGALSEKIAEKFASGNLEGSNTLLEGEHRFAKNLRRLFARAGYPVTTGWVGTKRCPIQTGSSGITNLKNLDWFAQAQGQMDHLLLQLIGELRPKSVILCGNYAAALAFGSRPRVNELKPTRMVLGYRTQFANEQRHVETMLITIQHPSRVRYSDIEKIQVARDAAA